MIVEEKDELVGSSTTYLGVSTSIWWLGFNTIGIGLSASEAIKYSIFVTCLFKKTI